MNCMTIDTAALVLAETGIETSRERRGAAA
jgi:hypothetical protein